MSTLSVRVFRTQLESQLERKLNPLRKIYANKSSRGASLSKRESRGMTTLLPLPYPHLLPSPLRTHSRAPEIKIQQPRTTSMDKTCGNMLTHSRYFKLKDAFYGDEREGEFLLLLLFSILGAKKTILRTFLHVFSRKPSAPPAWGLSKARSGAISKCCPRNLLHIGALYGWWMIETGRWVTTYRSCLDVYPLPPFQMVALFHLLKLYFPNKSNHVTYLLKASTAVPEC